MIRASICSPDNTFASSLERKILEFAISFGVKIEIDLYYYHSTLAESMIIDKIQYDLFFVDSAFVNDDEIDAMQIIASSGIIIYFFDIALNAEHVNMLSPTYILRKPVSPYDLSASLKKSLQQLYKIDTYFTFKTNSEYIKIKINDILYFESQKRMVYVHVVDGDIDTFYDKLDYIEDKINKSCKSDFWRIHQSYLVNAMHIFKKSYNKIVMNNGIELPISNSRIKYINESLIGEIENPMNVKYFKNQD